MLSHLLTTNSTLIYTPLYQQSVLLLECSNTKHSLPLKRSLASSHFLLALSFYYCFPSCLGPNPQNRCHYLPRHSQSPSPEEKYVVWFSRGMQDEMGMGGGGELMAQGAAAHQVLNHKRELTTSQSRHYSLCCCSTSSESCYYLILTLFYCGFCTSLFKSKKMDSIRNWHPSHPPFHPTFPSPATPCTRSKSIADSSSPQGSIHAVACLGLSGIN